MTYVLAWKTATSVYVHADSVATLEGNVPASVGTTSNFGETHIAGPGLLIEERIFKIRGVEGRYLFGVAGLMSTAQEIIRCFASELHRDRKRWVAHVFNDAIDIVLQPHTRGEVQIILGAVNENGSELFVYNRNGNQSVEIVKSVVHIGSLVSEKPDISNSIFHYVSNVVLPHEGSGHSLHLVNAYIQSFVLHNGLMEIGVGGVITGAKLTREGVQWPSDTIYLFYNGPDFHLTNKVLVFYRCDGVNIYNFSNNLPMNTAKINGFYLTSDGDELRRISEVIKEIDLTSLISSHEYVVFLSVYWQQSIVVPRNINFDPELYNIETGIEGALQKNTINIHQPLLQVLARHFTKMNCFVLVKEPDEQGKN